MLKMKKKPNNFLSILKDIADPILYLKAGGVCIFYWHLIISFDKTIYGRPIRYS